MSLFRRRPSTAKESPEKRIRALRLVIVQLKRQRDLAEDRAVTLSAELEAERSAGRRIAERYEDEISSLRGLLSRFGEARAPEPHPTAGRPGTFGMLQSVLVPEDEEGAEGGDPVPVTVGDAITRAMDILYSDTPPTTTVWFDEQKDEQPSGE